MKLYHDLSYYVVDAFVLMHSYVCICTHIRKKLCQEPIYSAISKCVELIYAFVNRVLMYTVYKYC
jgi:hypothetical protein